MKTNKSTASKSTELTDAPKNQVSTSNDPQIVMQPDNSTNPNPAVNSDNAVNSTTTANAVANENMFGNDQTTTEATARRQAAAQIGFRRVQGNVPHSGKGGEPSSGQHRGQHLGAA